MLQALVWARSGLFAEHLDALLRWFSALFLDWVQQYEIDIGAVETV